MRLQPRLEQLEDRTLPATITWTGNGANDLWSNPVNWDVRVPVDGDDVVIPDVPGSTAVVFDGTVPGTGVTLNSLRSAERFSLTGDTLTLTGTAPSLSAASPCPEAFSGARGR